MANTIKHKRGSGSDPSASDLVAGELAIRTDTGVVFTKKDDGTVVEVSGSGETNLGVSTTTTAVTVTSDTGNNATISEASGSAAGVMSVAHHDKLDGIESNATADQSATEILTAIKTVDGSGSGLDADTLDGVEGSSFLRSDTADTASGDITFSGGAAAVNIAANSDIRLPNGSSWTGDTTDPKIQAYDNYLYILGGSSGIVFRENNTNRAIIDGSGHFRPAADDTYDLGTSSAQWRNGYFDGTVNADALDVDGAADISSTLTLHNNLLMQDNDRIKIGAGNDLQIYHDGTNSSIENSTGDLYIQGQADDVIIRAADNILLQPQNGENGIKVIGNGAVELYYDNNNKLQTKSDGVNITGELQCDSLDVDGGANIAGEVYINENIRHNGDDNTYVGFVANDTFRVVTGGVERVRVTSTGAIAIEGSSNYGTSGQVLTSNGNDAPTWQDGGGTVASGCVYENSQTISANYSVTSGKNAMSAGPITIASGVTVTVTSGSTYTIV